MLLIPSAWIATALLLTTGSGPASTAFCSISGGCDPDGIPLEAALLVRVLVPGVEGLRGRNALIALAVLGLVIASS